MLIKRCFSSERRGSRSPKKDVACRKRNGNDGRELVSGCSAWQTQPENGSLWRALETLKKSSCLSSGTHGARGRLSHLRHHAAGLSAGAAGRDALFHVAKSLAGGGALFADLGALGADVRVVLRAAQHEVGANGADLRAVEHQLEVVGRNVSAAHFETMRRQMVQASRVTRLTVVDALFHFGCCVVDNNHLLELERL